MSIGSPPQAWGQHRPSAVQPACRPVHPHKRGDSAVLLPFTGPCEPVHPHKRGDSPRSRWQTPAAAGSPPQAWGQRDAMSSGSNHQRFTPTSVGTAYTTRVDDHRFPRFTPTSVGTAIHRTTNLICRFGSPPQAWGQRRGSWLRCLGTAVHPHKRGDSSRMGADSALANRFTPTSVGTAANSRLCALRAIGSPPQAWGQHSQRIRQQQRQAVHPHKRGDSLRADI